MRELYSFWILVLYLALLQPVNSLYGRKMADVVPQAPKAQQHESFHGPFTADRTRIDPNLVLILAALLCALFFGLGLNLIIRCALCLGSLVRLPLISAPRADHVTLRSVTATGHTGLKKAIVDALPVVVYDAAGSPVSTECVICLREFVEGEKMRVLPKCSHFFHVDCIDKWFVSHSLCPICRAHMADAPRDKPLANLPCTGCGHASAESTAQRTSETVAAEPLEPLPSDSASGNVGGTEVVAVETPTLS